MARIAQTAGRAAANPAARSAVSGVHRIYDFAAFCLSWSAPLFCSIAGVADLVAADLGLRLQHPDLALLPIRPMH
jgi:hypothetical protein